MTRQQILKRLNNEHPVTVPHSGNYLQVNPEYVTGESKDKFAMTASSNGEDIDAVIETFPTAAAALDYALNDWSIENITAG